MKTKNIKLREFKEGQYSRKPKMLRNSEKGFIWFYANPNNIDVVYSRPNATADMFSIPRSILKEYIERTENLK